MSIVSRFLFAGKNNRVDSGNAVLYQKGDVIDVLEGKVEPGRKTVPPNFVWINLTDGEFRKHHRYAEKWVAKFNYSQESLNIAEDEWRITMTLENIASDNRGGLTKEKVDKALKSWNMETIQIRANEVISEGKAYDVARSSAVLNETPQNALDKVAWSHPVYVEVSGYHEIVGDYSSTSFSAEDVDHALTLVDVVYHKVQEKEFRYSVTRKKLFEYFKNYGSEYLNDGLSMARWKIPENAIDQLKQKPSGTVEGTEAELIGQLIDKSTL